MATNSVNSDRSHEITTLGSTRNLTGEEILGGFIDRLSFSDYREAFEREFPALRCCRGSEGLIRYRKLGRDFRPNKAEKLRVFHWHLGYRAALRGWRPETYAN